MQPQEVVASMKNLQATANRVTIAHAAVSHALGEYLAFLGDYGITNFRDASEYTEAITRCMHESANSLLAFIDATKRLDRSLGNG